MLLEGLIVLTCAQGPGCSESTSAYYSYNKDAQRITDGVKDKAKKWAHANEWVVYAATPFYTLAVSKQAKVKLIKGLVLKIDTKDPGFGIEWTF